jgi:signal transduction histidine kinase
MSTDALEQSHETQARSFVAQGGIFAIAAIVIVLPAIPALGDYLRVGVRDAVVSLTPYLLTSTAATVLFKTRGVGRAYTVANHIESWTVAWVVHSLILASGSSHSIFWAFYAAQLTVLGVGHERRLHALAIVGGGPVLLALAFLVFRDSMTDAVLSLLLGGIGSVMILQLRDASDALRAKLATERGLRADLADVESRLARERLASPLHAELDARLGDVGAVVRALRTDTEDPSLERDLDALLVRVGGAQRELAIATRVLEGDARTWAEIASDLQARLVELTHSVELSFLDATEAAPETIAPERALGFERAVLEAVRNAVRHSRANKVEVRLLAGQTLRAEVRDDGTGLPPECFDRETGGIANLRHRAAHAGGRLDVTTGAGGTRIVFDVPNLAASTP